MNVDLDGLWNGGNVFERCWAQYGQRYQRLRDFVGGLATVFPGTATVESDFSVINSESNRCRTALTDLSLEGILHSKQWDEVRRLRYN